MGRRKLTESDFDSSKMGKNPFADLLNIHASDVEVLRDLKEVAVSDNIVTEVSGGMVLKTRYLAERLSFTKLFHVSGHRNKISSLPSRAKELFLWLLFTLKPSNDFIVINVDKYKAENLCSHNTYLRAIDDLIQADIIKPTRWQTVFWINPSYFFNGNRIKKYPDNINSVVKIQTDELK